jgi:hypothetical protein
MICDLVVMATSAAFFQFEHDASKIVRNATGIMRVAIAAADLRRDRFDATPMTVAPYCLAVELGITFASVGRPMAVFRTSRNSADYVRHGSTDESVLADPTT